MADVVKWTDNAGAFNNANATAPLPVAVYTGGTGATASQVQGNAASGAADSGNPVKTGGVYSANPTGVTAGQRVDSWLNPQGAINISGINIGAGVDAFTTTSAFAVHDSGGTTSGAVSTAGYLYNGTSWSRARGNIDTAALLTYAAAAAGTNGADQTNYNARGVKLVVDITAISGAGATLTVTVQGRDAASGKYYTILASAALAAVATTTLEIYPSIIAAANVTAGVTLPRVWRVIATIAGTTPAVTATVGASVIV